MTDRELMQQALDALETKYSDYIYDGAGSAIAGAFEDDVAALRAALAQPAPAVQVVLRQPNLFAADPAAPAVNCEWTNCPRRVGDVCCNDRPAAPAVPDGLRGAVNALLHQIEIGDFVDSNGHSAKMLKPVHDLMRLISESAAPAVREPKPLAAVNRYCAAGMCLPKDQHEAGCTAHGIGTQGGGT